MIISRNALRRSALVPLVWKLSITFVTEARNPTSLQKLATVSTSMDSGTADIDVSTSIRMVNLTAR
jgi:hypothetical protein